MKNRLSVSSGPKLPLELRREIKSLDANTNLNSLNGKRIKRKASRKLYREERRLYRTLGKSSFPDSDGTESSPTQNSCHVKIHRVSTRSGNKSTLGGLLEDDDCDVNESSSDSQEGSGQNSDEVNANRYISNLEKKLNITKGCRLLKDFENDGLLELLDGNGSSSEDNDSQTTSKQAYTKYLQHKRALNSQKLISCEGKAADFCEADATSSKPQPNRSQAKKYDKATVTGTYPNPYKPYPSSKQENVIPTPRVDITCNENDEQLQLKLQRQLKGLLNRLSLSNFPSIVKAIQDIYMQNARQYSTQAIIEAVLVPAKISALTDAFIILNAGFLAVIHRIIGNEFGARVLEWIVSALGIDKDSNLPSVEQKVTLNLVSFIAHLYVFGVYGPSIIFDFIIMFLGEITENNSETLLRIIRSCGHQLRSDDPPSLKDVIILLQSRLANTDGSLISVRTKFMIESINDLKNNRTKVAQRNKSVMYEQISEMKKIIQSINLPTKSIEPLQLKLSDILHADRTGKWWIIGAGWNPEFNNTRKSHTKPEDQSFVVKDSEDSKTLTDKLNNIARSLSMNTSVRRAIFVVVMSSSDYIEAKTRLVKLALRKSQQLEIPRVIVECTMTENLYNPYYGILAQQFCTEHRIRKAFEFTLWDQFKRMAPAMEFNRVWDSCTGNGKIPKMEDEFQPIELKHVVILAQFYGVLIGANCVPVTVLKALDLRVSLPTKVHVFVETMLATCFVRILKKRKAVRNMSIDTRETDAYMRKRVVRLLGCIEKQIESSTDKLARGLQNFVNRYTKDIVTTASVEMNGGAALVRRLCKLTEQTLADMLIDPKGLVN